MILAVAMWVFVVAEGTMLGGGLAEYNDKVGPIFGHEFVPDHTGPHWNRADEVKRRPIASALLSLLLLLVVFSGHRHAVLRISYCPLRPLWLPKVLDQF